MKLLLITLLPTLVLADPNVNKGKEVFTIYCTSCHGNEGRGDGPAASGLNPKPANFHDSNRAAKMTEKAQVNIVTNGGPVEGLSPMMPGFGETISAEDIQNVVAYIRSLK